MLPISSEPANSAFAWQDAACKVLKDVAKAGPDSGFIGFVQAGTGFGKTRACARIMATCSSEVRYTVALGLRTLTLRTGQSYRNELELSRQQVTTMVGESLVTRLQEEVEKQGSESRSAWFDDEISIDGDLCDDALPAALADMLAGADKHKQLLVAPILICTADHITAAADATRGRHLIATMRVLSADLVLDEIDNYEETALVALGKLVYLAGLAGRRVLLSSATLSPAIAQSLFQAYAEGYRAYAQRRDIAAPQIATGWFSQFTELCQVKWYRKADLSDPEVLKKKFARQRATYAKSLVSAMDKVPVKRSIQWLSLPDNGGMEELVQGIYHAARKLHQKFAGKDPVTGKHLSLGLIRVSNIKSCWQISRLLCEQVCDEQWDHRVVCYHARLSTLARWHTEQWLDKALNRKHPEAVWDVPLIRELLVSSSAQNIMIMVVATPVEEVGRDHDFDWGIFEPASTRSVVQSGGRIWRHRQPSGSTDNIILLPSVIREILTPGLTAVYRRPGVESDPDYLLSTHQAEALLPQDWHSRLDARHNLISPDDTEAEMTSLEHRKQWDYLLGQSPDCLTRRSRDGQVAGYSLGEWSEQPMLATNDRHAAGNPFRIRKQKVLYWLDVQENWWHIVVDASGQPLGQPKSADSQIEYPVISDSRLLLNRLIPGSQWQEHYQALKDRAYPHDSAEYAEQTLMGFEFEHSKNRQQIRYHFWLGAIRE